jgi:hypothetical protein
MGGFAGDLIPIKGGMKMVQKTMVLCAGRHEMPANDGAIFPGEINPLDVAGLEVQARKRLLEMFPEWKQGYGSLPNQICPTDILVAVRGELRLYVTGLSVALVAVINVCRWMGVDLTLLHFDRESGEYYPQMVD